jgi:hypothetical protein
MLDFSVSWLPLVVVGVANFILSWLYYSPVVPWFKTWQLGVGMDPNKKEMTEAEKKAMPSLFLGAIVATFLLPYGLQVLVHSLKAQDFVSGLVIGLVAWFAFSVTHSLNTRFEGRKVSVLVLNNILYLITYGVYGGILAVWK